MFKKCILLLIVIIGVFATDTAFAKSKKRSKQAVHATQKSRSKKGKKKSRVVVKRHSKKRTHLPVNVEKEVINTTVDLNGEKIISNPKQMIAINNEKNRITDSLHKASFQNNIKEDKEGYFASMFASKNKSASFQTIEGTAAVFKSMSGWDDKKFYVLTNLLPIGTIVRITTPEFKSVCAKVINSLPEVGNTVQYRLNDAAAAILGINNKTFPVTVTY
jgi:hypothetical protein